MVEQRRLGFKAEVRTSQQLYYHYCSGIESQVTPQGRHTAATGPWHR